MIREGGRRRSPEGGVQCILERSTTSLLAQVEQQENQLVATPLDDRVLATIKLPDGDSQYVQEEPQPPWSKSSWTATRWLSSRRKDTLPVSFRSMGGGR